jgi:hypothetical protein
MKPKYNICRGCPRCRVSSSRGGRRCISAEDLDELNKMGIVTLHNSRYLYEMQDLPDDCLRVLEQSLSLAKPYWPREENSNDG